MSYFSSVSHHQQADYLTWVEANNFVFMLPKDLKAQWEKAKENAQSCLDSHLEEKPAKKHVVLYSDVQFQQVAIEWLVSTDQVSFKPFLLLY